MDKPNLMESLNLLGAAQEAIIIARSTQTDETAKMRSVTMRRDDYLNLHNVHVTDAERTIEALVAALEAARTIIVGFEPENGGIASDEEIVQIEDALALARGEG